jgi:hypothetical protein
MGIPSLKIEKGAGKLSMDLCCSRRVDVIIDYGLFGIDGIYLKKCGLNHSECHFFSFFGFHKVFFIDRLAHLFGRLCAGLLNDICIAYANLVYGYFGEIQQFVGKFTLLYSWIVSMKMRNSKINSLYQLKLRTANRILLRGDGFSVAYWPQIALIGNFIGYWQVILPYLRIIHIHHKGLNKALGSYFRPNNMSVLAYVGRIFYLESVRMQKFIDCLLSRVLIMLTSMKTMLMRQLGIRKDMDLGCDDIHRKYLINSFKSMSYKKCRSLHYQMSSSRLKVLENILGISKLFCAEV